MRLLFGLPVRAETIEQAVAAIDERVRAKQRTMHSVLNAAKVSKLARHAEFREQMAAFDMIHADGASIVLAAKLLGRPLPERVAGIDLMQRLVELAAARGYRCYFLGATPEVVSKTVELLSAQHPGLIVAGQHHGYWKEADPIEEQELVREIQSSCPDILFVAMPTPRKERFLIRQGEALGATFAMGVGGSFDVVAGLVKRAPEAWQRVGMEWAYRLLQEPGRMWKRYLVTNSHFAWLLLKELLKGGRGGGAPAR